MPIPLPPDASSLGSHPDRLDALAYFFLQNHQGTNPLLQGEEPPLDPQRICPRGGWNLTCW